MIDNNNPKIKRYRLGKSPSAIKAAIEYLNGYTQGVVGITLNSLSEKYQIHERTIANHAKNIAELLNIPRKIMRDGQPTFLRALDDVKAIRVQCPYCNKEFLVSAVGRVLKNDKR